jgi:uncharacterized protein (TIGR00730 family)
MGRVARAHQAAGGRALGVIPQHLFPREVAKGDLDRFVVTETMHERKKVMFMNAEAVVCLPGGAGSLDEFFEVLTWRQIGLHGKPILLLDWRATGSRSSRCCGMWWSRGSRGRRCWAS